MSEPDVGTVMKDGTVYAGISPKTGNMMFAMPKDSVATMTFEGAVARAERINLAKAFGHDNWRLPNRKELDVIFSNKEKGALKETFNEAGADYGDMGLKKEARGWYGTSDPGSVVTRWCQLFKTGYSAHIFKTSTTSVRYIRDGESPGLLPMPYKTSAVTIARQDRLKETARRRRPKIEPA